MKSAVSGFNLAWITDRHLAWEPIWTRHYHFFLLFYGINLMQINVSRYTMFRWGLFSQLFLTSFMMAPIYTQKTAERFYVKLITNFSGLYFSLLLSMKLRNSFAQQKMVNSFVTVTGDERVWEGIPSRQRNSLAVKKKTGR